MGFFDFVKDKNNDGIGLEEKLNINLLSNEMQAKAYKGVQNIKYCSDQLCRIQSQDNISNFQKAVSEAFEASADIYEWLEEKKIIELNGMIIMASFYLVNLSDVTLKDPTQFSDIEISNTIDTFLAAMGVQQGQIDTSSYGKFVRIGINWLLKHPTS